MLTRFFSLSTFVGFCAVAAGPSVPFTLQVNSGTVEFDSATNLSAISVHGKAPLKAEARGLRGNDGLALDEVRATIPVAALNTGMGLRDEHMRKYIFTTASGSQPDVVFSAAGFHCAAQPGQTTACPAQGTLSIRGIERPFTAALKVKQEANGFKVSGTATVKLSDYGIERPSQLGVQTKDEVALKIEFTGRETTETVSAGGVR